MKSSISILVYQDSSKNLLDTCACLLLSIPGTSPFFKASHGQNGVLCSIWSDRSRWYHGHLVIAYLTYEMLSRQQVFLPSLLFMWSFSILCFSVLSESIKKCAVWGICHVCQRIAMAANGLPGYKDIRPYLLAGFYQWIHTAIIPRAAPLRLLNIVCSNKALLGMV